MGMNLYAGAQYTYLVNGVLGNDAPGRRKSPRKKAEKMVNTAKYRDDRGGSGTGLRSGNEFGLNDFELTFIMH